MNAHVEGVNDKQYARVAVDVALFSLDKPYDYRLPAELAPTAAPGCRVLVPFGKGNTRTEGVILSLEEEPSYSNLKSILRLLDSEPVLTEEQIKLARWMRQYFFCTFFDAVHTMLPSGMWYRDGKRRCAGKREWWAILAVEAGEAMETAERKRLRARQQAAVLRLLAVTGTASLSDLREFTGAGAPSLRALEQQGYLTLEERETLRVPKRVQDAPPPEITLNGEQQSAFVGLRGLLDGSAAAALLFGVTGSGKTLVYICLIREVLLRGKTAIVLVPEIALTPQLVEIFSKHFGEDIAVLHSSLGIGERLDEWNRIRSGRVRVVIGTRSAVFAPLDRLGLIVIDEEQERTYKSENTPRYHARDVAKYRCAHAGALLLLGSATPSVESMYAAQQGRYSLFTIAGRYNTKQLPSVLLADMRQELRGSANCDLSETLLRELRENVDRGEQSILFINRRGTSSLVVCGECGYVYNCPNCSVSLTYHAANGRLMCHYCGHSQPIQGCCPVCGGRLKYSGAGTQKVEEELRELLPGVDVVRMDTDTVSAAHSHEAILKRFREERVPILLGTQMVTKGLDFGNVTLVGVLSADQALYANDYRAGERAFSLITQVIGRSGRREKVGRAVIQTFTPDNEIIQLASRQDYMGFFRREIALRRAQRCPPETELFTMTVTGQEEGAVLRGCVLLRESLCGYLSDLPDARILGPAPAGVTRVNNRYRYRITLSCTGTQRIRDTIAYLLRAFTGDSRNRGLVVYADCDPSD